MCTFLIKMLCITLVVSQPFWVVAPVIHILLIDIGIKVSGNISFVKRQEGGQCLCPLVLHFAV